MGKKKKEIFDYYNPCFNMNARHYSFILDLMSLPKNSVLMMYMWNDVYIILCPALEDGFLLVSNQTCTIAQMQLCNETVFLSYN